jgi:hypothetical protein
LVSGAQQPGHLGRRPAVTIRRALPTPGRWLPALCDRHLDLRNNRPRRSIGLCGLLGDCALLYAHAGRWPSTLLIGHLVKRILLFLVAPVFAPSISANAQADDKAYCAQLSAFYRKYVQNTSRRVDVEALAALDDCQKGNAATAIAVLEDRLRRGGFSLPKEFTP